MAKINIIKYTECCYICCFIKNIIKNCKSVTFEMNETYVKFTVKMKKNKYFLSYQTKLDYELDELIMDIVGRIIEDHIDDEIKSDVHIRR